jgi:hypothetical protein
MAKGASVTITVDRSQICTETASYAIVNGQSCAVLRMPILCICVCTSLAFLYANSAVFGRRSNLHGAVEDVRSAPPLSW